MSLGDNIQDAVNIFHEGSEFLHAVATGAEGVTVPNPVTGNPQETLAEVLRSIRADVTTPPKTMPVGTYTLQVGDENYMLNNSGGQVKVIVPDDATENFEIGTAMIFYRDANERLFLEAGSGVELVSAWGIECAVRYSVMTAVKVDANKWLVFGDVA